MPEWIPVTFSKVLQSKSYTVLILGTESKRFSIYVETGVGKSLQNYLTGKKKSRPSSHELLRNILEAYAIRPIQVVIYDVQDGIYFARLFLETENAGKLHIVEVDARPSDCILLAVLENLPLYCKKEVLEKAIPDEIQ